MDEIQIKFTLSERDLIINHTFAYSDLTNKLQFAEIMGNQIIVKYSTGALDDLIGFIALEAYYPANKKIGKEFNILIEKLIRIRKTNMGDNFINE
jgi:hypothetical protein